jgi:hypothetical protein
MESLDKFRQVSEETRVQHVDGHQGSDAPRPLTVVYSFCEEDYVISFYVAEFINSISNFAYGTFATIKHDSGSPA